MRAIAGFGWHQIQSSTAFEILIRGLRRLQWQDGSLCPELKLNTIDLHGWVLYPAALSPRSVAYTIGVGDDICFELAMIRQFEAEVHAFDATPEVATWIASKELPDSYNFHGWAAAGRDGNVNLRRWPGECHPASHCGSPLSSKHEVQAIPAYSLKTLMKKLRHAHVDLLKINIDNAGSTVLDELVRTDIRPGQLLLGFRHCESSLKDEVIAATVQRLRKIGYRIFSVSKSGQEISLLF
ncbi:hypothetical protein [Woeseia oceani]|uniref:Methyltransferase FkbM domain-containing protein n=1 Tax=Woeseia oceani TaxID=1548547 RepID=A0A193LF75_9GAMM|nr:hypothetical protein [Woeseia oceani]ANO51157.1 hypothetical protein BA177_08020 [Woeseia oceani]